MTNGARDKAKISGKEEKWEVQKESQLVRMTRHQEALAMQDEME